MKIYFHIGVDKAGSTAIQAHLQLNKGWFRQRGLVVPSTGFHGIIGHQKLLSSHSGELWAEFHAEMQRAEREGARGAILSWEGVQFLEASELQSIAKALAGYPLELLCYIREQSSIIQSGYLQHVKRRAEPLSYGQFAEDAERLTPSSRHYDAMLGRVEQALGATALTVRVFEKDKLVDGNSVVDFLDFLELEPGDDFVLSRKQQNISLDFPSVALLNLLDDYYLNRESYPAEASSSELGSAVLGDAASDLARQIGGSTAEIEDALYYYLTDKEGRKALVDILLEDIARNGAGARFFLQKSVVETIQAHYRSSNQSVNERYLHGTGADGPFDASLKPWNDASADELSAAVARKIALLLELREFPPWDGECLLGSAMERVAPAHAGWQAADGKLSAIGGLSYLRFNIPNRGRSPFAKHLVLALAGGCLSDQPQQTVTINGRPALELVPSEGTITCSLADVAGFGVVEVAIENRGRGPVATTSSCLSAIEYTIK